MVLPLFGGAPAVWNTCVVFYQLMLVGGYLYAHAVTKWLAPKRQVLVQAAVMAAALLVLPVRPATAWMPQAESMVVPGMLLLLLMSLGLPFFAVSSIAPLLQRWFTQTGHKHAADPYFLYGASNIGSLAGLLAYPIFIEPNLRVATQSTMWAVGYGLLIVLVLLCGSRIWHRKPSAEPDAAAHSKASTLPPPATVTTRDRLRWLLQSAVPASLMLSVTTYVSTDVAAVPLLWVVPLGLYLVTFIMAFARRQIVPAWLASAILPLLVLLSAFSMALDLTRPITTFVPLHVVTFFVAAVVCHGQLAQARPHVSRLTEYYVWISVGGALGGLFNVLVAPLLFVKTLEYPLALALACWLRTVPKFGTGQRWWAVDLVAAVVPGAQLAALLLITRRLGIGSDDFTVNSILFGVPLLVTLVFWAWPMRFATGLLGFFVAANFLGASAQPILHAERGFYGSHVVTDEGRLHRLMHGTTNHGAQATDPERRLEPLTYYNRPGPIGQVFEQVRPADARWNVGVIGLGTASLASYARPGEHWTFYEINPAVERMARDPGLFTLLDSSAGNTRVVIGDARLSLQASTELYDVLVVDAFSSDAIPVHLITREALQLYRAHLTPHGIVAFHISNRYLDLAPVVAQLAAAEGLVVIMRSHTITPAEDAEGLASSTWAMVARAPEDVEALARDDRWNFIAGEAQDAWTDDFSNIWSVFSW